MLQQSTNPPQILSQPKRVRASVNKSPLDVIDTSIQPIADDSGRDLLDALCCMKDENDIAGMIELYGAYAAAGEKFMDAGERLESRAGNLLDDEGNYAWAKAYLVADFLKQMRPSQWMAERYIHTLFDAAYRMGGSLEELGALVSEIASWELEAPLPPMVR